MIAERLNTLELDRIAEVLQQGSYEGYPVQSQRLYLGATGLYLSGVTLVVPDGPWHIDNHSNRHNTDPLLMDIEVPSPGHPKVTSELSKQWSEQGLLLDQYGRPIHPDWAQLLADERIGLPTGTGFFRRYAANETLDPIVYREYQDSGNLPELLLIKRDKGQRWALPGGFLDREDSSPAAGARREAGEETGLVAIGGTDEVLLHKRAVGLRDTLNAWTENTVILIHGQQEYLFDTEPVPGDDAIDVGWFTREQIEGLLMFDAHLQYIDTALARIRP